MKSNFTIEGHKALAVRATDCAGHVHSSFEGVLIDPRTLSGYRGCTGLKQE